jgi:hypothetical protein
MFVKAYNETREHGVINGFTPSEMFLQHSINCIPTILPHRKVSSTCVSTTSTQISFLSLFIFYKL